MIILVRYSEICKTKSSESGLMPNRTRIIAISMRHVQRTKEGQLTDILNGNYQKMMVQREKNIRQVELKVRLNLTSENDTYKR